MEPTLIPRLAWTLLAARRHPGWRDRLALLRRVASLEGPAYRAWHEEALDRHLRWAAATVPWWRARIRPTDRLEDLPPLTRADLRRGVGALRDPARRVARLVRHASGGSTGEPVVVYQDAAYFTWDHAVEVHVGERWGIAPWARSAYVWGADRDLDTLPTRERLWLRLLDRRVVNAFRMGERNLPRIADGLASFDPTVLQGYASALDLLAGWLLRHRPGHAIRPRLVRSSAETLLPAVRARLQRAFRAPVCDFYGSRECASLAAECPEGSLHVQGATRHLEVVDDRGRPCAPGKIGRVLVTDLTNKAFGLIRYETGDVAAWGAEGPCPCGLPFPRLARLFGRMSDFLTAPTGERVHGEWFTHLFYERRGVERFQVVQSALDRVLVRTVGPAGERDLAEVLEAVRERLGPAVTVTWERVERIDTTASGKHRFTISTVPWGGAIP